MVTLRLVPLALLVALAACGSNDDPQSPTPQGRLSTAGTLVHPPVVRGEWYTPDLGTDRFELVVTWPDRPHERIDIEYWVSTAGRYTRQPGTTGVQIANVATPHELDIEVADVPGTSTVDVLLEIRATGSADRWYVELAAGREFQENYAEVAYGSFHIKAVPAQPQISGQVGFKRIPAPASEVVIDPSKCGLRVVDFATSKNTIVTIWFEDSPPTTWATRLLANASVNGGTRAQGNNAIEVGVANFAQTPSSFPRTTREVYLYIDIAAEHDDRIVHWRFFSDALDLSKVTEAGPNDPFTIGAPNIDRAVSVSLIRPR